MASMGMLLLIRPEGLRRPPRPETPPEAREPPRRARPPLPGGARGGRALAHRGGAARGPLTPLPHAARGRPRERLAGTPRRPGRGAARAAARAVRRRRLARAAAARGAAGPARR